MSTFSACIGRFVCMVRRVSVSSRGYCCAASRVHILYIVICNLCVSYVLMMRSEIAKRCPRAAEFLANYGYLYIFAPRNETQRLNEKTRRQS